MYETSLSWLHALCLDISLKNPCQPHNLVENALSYAQTFLITRCVAYEIVFLKRIWGTLLSHIHT